MYALISLLIITFFLFNLELAMPLVILRQGVSLAD